MARRARVAVAAAWVVACRGEPPERADACDGSPYTWDTVGRPVLQTWCTPCHSSALAPEFRSDAPPGVDFDSYAGVAPWADRIAARVSSGTMPPSGGLPAEDAERLLAWLGCGAPGGTTAAPDPCAAPVAVASFAGCDGGAVAVGGPLVVGGDADWSCVCSVDGDLRVEGGVDVDLAQLRRVGGEVVLTAPDLDRFAAGALGSAAALRVDGSGVTAIELPALVALGSVDVARAPRLVALDLPELARVDTQIRLTDCDALELVALDRLAELGGDYRIERAPRLEVVRGTHAVKSLGGSIVWQDLPALARGPDEFSELVSLGGGITLERTGATSVQGWDRLPEIPGDLVLRDNPRLEVSRGFPVTTRVLGDVICEDNPAFLGWIGLVALTEVGGDLRLARNGLGQIPYLPSLQAVAGDLIVVDNPSLSTADAEALAASIEVGGAVVIDGNGP